MSQQGEAVRVERRADRDIAIDGTFAVPRHTLFEAITRPEHLKAWMSAAGFTIADVQVDPRTGGGFRYVYRRPNGKTIEVRGVYRTFDPPNGYSYLESYDFSPLQIEVTTALVEVSGGTRFTQTLHYRTTAERDGDYDNVATSSREALGKLARYLAARQDGR